MTKIILIFESIPDEENSPQGPNRQLFVDAHDESGKSINVGVWSADGEYEALTIDCAKLCNEPFLGLATTAALLKELQVRAEVGGYADYRTVTNLDALPRHVDATSPTTTAAQHVKHLDDVTAVASDPGNALASDYMRGMANGLILAQSIFKGGNPQFIDANGNRVERSADDWAMEAPSTVASSNEAWASDRMTFVVPEGFAAVTDHEGRATGELRKLP